MNKLSTGVLLCNVETSIAYSGTKLSSKFKLKDPTKKDHQHDGVYYAKCPEEQCTEDYTGNRKASYRTCESHSGKDLQSYLFKYTMETNHKTVTLGQNFHAN